MRGALRAPPVPPVTCVNVRNNERVDDELIGMIDDATSRLLVTAGSLGDGAIAEPSLLPGWSRGHVLAHLARNADALRNLLIWARTGVVTPGYRSQQAREDDIEAGAGRPAAEQLADIARSAEAFAAEARSVPAGA